MPCGFAGASPAVSRPLEKIAFQHVFWITVSILLALIIASALGQVLFLCPFGRRNFIATGQSAPVLRPSSPPRGRCFCRHRQGVIEAAKTAAKPRLQAGAKPHTGSWGVPGRTPCRRQGIVRYTAPTTAHENARPALMGPGVFVGGETAAAQAPNQHRLSCGGFHLAGWYVKKAGDDCPAICIRKE